MCSHVRFWHKADISTHSSNVRFWAKADIRRRHRFAADSNEKASSRNVNGLEHDYRSSLQSQRL
jgi:hypothetical protein